MVENIIKIKNTKDEILIGIEVLPTVENKKFPVVIMVHGFHYFKEEDGIFIEVGKKLAKIGIASYRFDFSGCGESEGDYSQTSLSKLRDDLKTILDYVKSKDTTNVDRLGIFSQSFGTTITVALHPQVKTIILMGAFINPGEVFKTYFGADYNPDGVSIKNHDDGRVTKIHPQFWKDFENHDLVSLLKNIHSSLLLIWGTNDDTIPYSSVEQIFQEANEPKEKVIIQGADHGMEPKREEMYKVVIDWFKKTL